ncbi:hypothetical protein MMC25_006294 [Agyrium rufum]|nr:hypothetical protein [Agyrium rufum]
MFKGPYGFLGWRAQTPAVQSESSLQRLLDQPWTSFSSSHGDDKGIEERDFTPHSRRRGKTSRSSNRCTTFLWLLLNVSALVAIYYITQDRTLAGTVASPFPQAQWEERIFHPVNLEPTMESEMDWAANGPHGSEFFIVDDPEQYNLPPGSAYRGKQNQYGVTWAHQYHCLWMLRTEFWKFVQNESTLVGADISSHDEDSAYFWHLAHCFGYIRETIVCNMDMTVEYPTLNELSVGNVNGYEIPHQCKRREPLDQFMQQHAPIKEGVTTTAKEFLDTHRHDHHDHGQ